MNSKQIHAEWAQIGGGFTVPPAEHRVDLEELVIRTCALAPGEARLFWVAASWLAVHHNLVNTRKLGRLLDRQDPLSRAMAGALMSVALEIAPAAAQLRSVARHGQPLAERRPLFDSMAGNPVL